MTSKKLHQKVKSHYGASAALYKGYTMGGDYGWIARPFGKNEIYLGATLKDAHGKVDALHVWHEEVAESYDVLEPPYYFSITEVAENAGVGRQYVKDEVRRGNLPAVKVGRQYQIEFRDFEAWMANPRRGSRT